MSKSDDKQLEVGGTNQGGGTLTSSKFRQEVNFGEAVAGNRLSSSKFGVFPGFLGASLSGATKAVPLAELDLSVLYAKTDPVGTVITPQVWQLDQDPVFVWQPPATGLDIAGYSYAFNQAPDDTVDTTATSYNVAGGASGPLVDGKQTFSVKAINSAGIAGKPLSIELWVDTTPPQIATYAPAPGGLLNAASPSVSATLSDASSGVDASTVSLLINGGSASVTVNTATGVMMTSAGAGAWKEGLNRLELRVKDAVGNAQVPLLWSVTLDTIAPSGTVAINAGTEMTTSVYVTLGLAASDAVSGVNRILVSNQALTGYVEEPYVSLRELWKLNPVRGAQSVYVKFVDQAGNTSEPVSDAIELILLSPETVITSGPAGFTPDRSGAFAFMCPEGDCVFSYAFDAEVWSAWSSEPSASTADLVFGNHYFRVKAAKETNGTPGIQLDEEDPSPAERAWVVGVEPSMFPVPKGPPIKVWRLE